MQVLLRISCHTDTLTGGPTSALSLKAETCRQIERQEEHKFYVWHKFHQRESRRNSSQWPSAHDELNADVNRGELAANRTRPHGERGLGRRRLEHGPEPGAARAGDGGHVHAAVAHPLDPAVRLLGPVLEPVAGRSQFTKQTEPENEGVQGPGDHERRLGNSWMKRMKRMHGQVKQHVLFALTSL